MAGIAEQLFCFQFSASAIELPSDGTSSENHMDTTLAFRLFDFPSVLLHLQRAYGNADDSLLECPPKRLKRLRVRGGKSCVFSMPSEKLKSLSETSQLYVMLTRTGSVSSHESWQDAEGGQQLLAASALSLQGLVETCLAGPGPARHKHSVLLYQGSRLYAKANVKLCLQRKQVAAEGGESDGGDLTSDRATGQSKGVQKKVEKRLRAEAHVVGPPAMLFTASKLKQHHSTPQNASAKTSLLNSDSVPTESCSTISSTHKTVWPNGYVEEEVCDETVLAVDPLPTTTHVTLNDIRSPLEECRYPILQALLKELSIIRSHPQEVPFQEDSEVVVGRRLSDKCLQTEEQLDVPSSHVGDCMQQRVVKRSVQRPFVRACCAIKHVPGDQEATVKKKVTQTKKPTQIPLQSSKAKVSPFACDDPHVYTVGQVETTTSVQLPVCARPPSGDAASKVEMAGKKAATAQLNDTPITSCTVEAALSGLKESDSCQGLSHAQEGDKGDTSGDIHVECRDDRTDSCVDSKGYKNDNHVDSKGNRSDKYSDSRHHRSDNRASHRSDVDVDSADEKGHESQGHSSIYKASAETPCSEHVSPQSVRSTDSSTSNGNTKKPTKVRKRGDSAGGSDKHQKSHPLQPSSVCSPDVSRCSARDEVGSTAGYSVDSLEGGRSVVTPTGVSSNVLDSYTEDFESSYNSSQDPNPVSNSDWNQDECPSPQPVGKERLKTSISTASISSSTTHTNATDQ